MKKLSIFAFLTLVCLGVKATTVEVYNATVAGINMDIKPPLFGGWKRVTIQPESITIVRDLGDVGKIAIELIGFGGAKLEIDNSNVLKNQTLRVYIMKIGTELVLTTGWPNDVKRAPISASYLPPRGYVAQYF